MGATAKNIVLFGDNVGIPPLLEFIPKERIVGIVGASIRPRYLDELRENAKELQVPLIVQPKYRDKMLYASFLHEFRELKADSLICYSYSMLVQDDILQAVDYNAFNIHFSLLPKNRGPNPVQWALIHGEEKTGVTFHQMGDGFDNGAIVDQIAFEINEADTWVDIFEKSKLEAKPLIKRVLPRLFTGSWIAQAQDERVASLNPRISPEGFEIKFGTMSDKDIFNLIKAQVSPLNGPYLETEKGRIYFNQLLSLPEISQLRAQYSAN